MTNLVHDNEPNHEENLEFNKSDKNENDDGVVNNKN